jgi:hypothetical protein
MLRVELQTSLECRRCLLLPLRPQISLPEAIEGVGLVGEEGGPARDLIPPRLQFDGIGLLGRPENPG